MASLKEEAREDAKDVAEAEADIAYQLEESELIQWGPQQEGKRFGYLGPLSIDDIGFESLSSDGLPEEEILIDDLHKGTEVVLLHQHKKSSTVHIKVSKDDMYLLTGLMQSEDKPIYSIVEMRRGQKTRVFEAHKISQGPYANHADMSMSLVFTERKVLNLVFNSVAECDIWWNGLSVLIEKAKQSDLVVYYLKSMFNQYNQEGLPRKLVRDMLHQLHYRTSKEELHRMFSDADANSDGVLVFSEFLTLIKQIQKRPEIADLFHKYAKDECMTAEELCDFFHLEQSEDGWTREKCQIMIDKQEKGMDLETFELMINSPWNMLYSAYQHTHVYHDMTRPLSHYFLSSSHNTYLERGQIRGYSATDMYIRSLKLGAKCIELDTWDGANGEPTIYHGHTLVSHISFTDTLEVIRDYAFIKSDFPLILSIENHCSVPQQIKMAKYFKEILGDLLAPPFEIDPTEPRLPSPEQLRGKIILKGKVLAGSYIESEESASSCGFSAGKIAYDLSKMIHLKLMPILALSKVTGSDPHPCEMLNFSEGTAQKVGKKKMRNILKYNQNNLSRTYTKGTRIRSTNYRPCAPWSMGCQIVAYNFQTAGIARYIQEGMFADNGGCGYVLKPEPLNSDVSNYHPHHKQHVIGSKYRKLTVQILSGRNLPVTQIKGHVNPFVSVEVHGIPVDNASHKTRAVHGNGISPSWNETFEFPLYMSQLAVLVLKVGTHNDLRMKFSYKHIGHFACRVENLRPGYRVVPLVNQQGYQSGFGNLLCKITLD